MTVTRKLTKGSKLSPKLSLWLPSSDQESTNIQDNFRIWFLYVLTGINGETVEVLWVVEGVPSVPGGEGGEMLRLRKMPAGKLLLLLLLLQVFSAHNGSGPVCSRGSVARPDDIPNKTCTARNYPLHLDPRLWHRTKWWNFYTISFSSKFSYSLKKEQKMTFFYFFSMYCI
jgi:hypothetical protein